MRLIQPCRGFLLAEDGRGRADQPRGVPERLPRQPLHRRVFDPGGKRRDAGRFGASLGRFFLNLALFLFNLVPLLPLDGGQVVGAVWEGVKKTWARLRGRPDPGYVDVAKALPIAYAVSTGLIAMTLLLAYADLVTPIKLG